MGKIKRSRVEKSTSDSYALSSQQITFSQLYTKAREEIPLHLVNTTALNAVATPPYAALEVGLAKMTDDISLGSRLTAAGLGYAGIAWLYSKGRDLSKRVLQITDKSKERIQAVHDAIYTAAFNGVACFPLYLWMGADSKQAAIGSLIGAAVSVPLGPVLGYAVDAAGELTGIRPNHRISHSFDSLAETLEKRNILKPTLHYLANKSRRVGEFVSELRPRSKKTLAALLLTGSIAATAGVYALTSDESDTSISTPQTIEIQNK